MRSVLPEALAAALGAVVAEVHRRGLADLELLRAKSEVIIATLEARVAQLEGQIAERIEREACRIAETITIPGPPGEPGLPGEPGPQGERGEPGERGAKGEPGRDGRDGLNGLQGAMGERGADGKDGRDGADGKDGRDGVDGADGKHGLGFDDIGQDEDERSFSFVFKCNGDMRTLTFAKSTLPDWWRNSWKDGTAYLRGEVVQHDGSPWMAMRDTKQRPGMPDSGWQLLAKRGQHGRDGKDGERGPPGPEGKPGRDATQLGPNGGKW